MKRPHTGFAKSIFIGVGSNLGRSYKNCVTAIKHISSDERVNLRSISSFYLTSPVSNIEQDDFVNCAIVIDWIGEPEELLGFLQHIETSMGRVREKKNGPRVIDLDILLYGTLIINTDTLTVPHKELHRRKFALMPCIEIEPDLVLARPLASFLPEIGDEQRIEKLEGVGFDEGE
ncbi:MAG: 2-amino-4-hydroxy-6-hydroxymethyldihydropteridine diphosphokinase [Syntrophorhabdaceae bacterium]